MIRKKIHFYGQVQGVGFRYTARWAARALDLTGWVRNEADGSVTMEVQGYEDSINRMLERLNDDSYIRIERISSEEIPVEKKERSFRVC